VYYEYFVTLQHYNKSKDMEKLTKQEEEVMKRIWKLKSCYVKDIIKQLPEPKPPYTTVASVVKNLQRKGFVSSERTGNTYRYITKIDRDEYKRNFLGSVVKDYFKDSYKELVTFFTREQRLSPEDLKEIIDEIEKNK